MRKLKPSLKLRKKAASKALELSEEAKATWTPQQRAFKERLDQRRAKKLEVDEQEEREMKRRAEALEKTIRDALGVDPSLEEMVQIEEAKKNLRLCVNKVKEGIDDGHSRIQR